MSAHNSIIDRRSGLLLTLASALLLNGCTAAFNPRIYPPDGIAETIDYAESIPTSPWNRGESDTLEEYSYCIRYHNKAKELPYAGADLKHAKRMSAAKARARCVQEQLARRLDNVEDIEVVTRISLFMLGLGATAVGIFDGSDDLIASLALGAGLTTGLRGFTPLEARQNLYFSAIGALECSIMTADALAGQGNSVEFTERVFKLLEDDMNDSDKPDDGEQSNEQSMEPNELATRENPSKSIREIMNKRLYVFRSGASVPEDSKAINPVSEGKNSNRQMISSDSYADYLRSDTRIFGYLEPSDVSQNNGSGNGYVPTLMELASSLTRDTQKKNGPYANAVSSLVVSNAAQLNLDNRRLVQALTETIERQRKAIARAPQDLEHATTLIAIAVNKILVEEQPDTGALIDAARKSMMQFLDDVQSARKELAVADEQQKPELEAARQTAETILPFTISTAAADNGNGGGDGNDDGGEDDGGTSVDDGWNAYQSALEDIADTRATIDATIRMITETSNYPEACRTLINGNT